MARRKQSLTGSLFLLAIFPKFVIVSHKGIRLLIETTAKSLGDDIQFTYGRDSDFNVMRDKRYPFIQLDLLSSNASFSVNNVSNYSKGWNIQIIFYQLDDAASTQDEYAKILDDMDFLVDSFITKLNFYNDNNLLIGSCDIIIQSIVQQPFVKALADFLTGYSVTFQIIVPDNWDYCVDC